MDKPEDIPQWAWDEAKAATEQYGYNDGDERIVSNVARAILSAQSQAYIDAARIAEECSLSVPLGNGLADGASMARGQISAAILQRKEEIGRN